MARSRLGPRPRVLPAVPSGELAGWPPPSLPPGSWSVAQKTVFKFCPPTLQDLSAADTIHHRENESGESRLITQMVDGKKHLPS